LVVNGKSEITVHLDRYPFSMNCGNHKGPIYYAGIIFGIIDAEKIRKYFGKINLFVWIIGKKLCILLAVKY